MRYFKAVIALISGTLLFVSLTLAQEKTPPPPGGFPENQGLAKNKKAPNFTYKTLDGNKITLSDYRGRYVLIDFWGSWCKPCLAEMPYLKKAYAKFRDQITFIGVAADNNKQAVIKYVNNNDIPWPQIIVPLSAENPPKIVEDYNVRMYPSVFLIGPEGFILNGAKSPQEQTKLKKDNLIKTLTKLLDEQ